jgi:hypothetical protein
MTRFLVETRSLILIPILGLPIASLGLFVGLRAWTIKIGKETHRESDE